jgi:ABC-type multidrug transport system ATPase subunit
MEEAEKLCERLVVMDRGHILASGTPHDLVRRRFRAMRWKCATRVTRCTRHRRCGCGRAQQRAFVLCRGR